MNSLQRSYIQLNKGIEGLSNIDIMTLSEFKHNKSEYQSQKEEVDKATQNITHFIKTLQSTEITKDDLKVFNQFIPYRKKQITSSIKYNLN